MWITKYALTKRGVFKVEAHIEEPGLAIVGQYGSIVYCGEGREWHRTEESAVRRVREMISTRRTSIEKELKKLSAIETQLDNNVLATTEDPSY